MLLTPRTQTLGESISHRAADSADRTAFTFLPDGENESHSWTFAELERRARALAERLAASVAPGERALILAPDAPDFVLAFFACQFAGVVAVPVYPPFPLSSDRRIATLRTIARDSGARIVLTGAPEQIRDLLVPLAPELSALTWIGVDAGDDTDFEPVAVRGADISFLQYTSGSTSAPKGVVVTHEALMYNQELISRAMGYHRDARVVGWLPLFHDMGLMGTVVPAVYTGCSTVLMPPLQFVQRPVRWLRAVTEYSATITGGPNFAYELCCRRIRESEREDIDLSSLEVAFNGAEPIREATLAQFAAAFEPHGFDARSFYPCYGLAESTLFTTGAVRGAGAVRVEVDRAELHAGRFAPGSGQVMVSSGRPELDRRLAIVDPDTGVALPDGTVGEIWIGGPDVAAGYWEKPAATAETFSASTTEPADGPYLRSGDLGVLHDGELYVVGRRKDLIILGGRNYYPQDIEAAVEAASTSIRRGCTAAFAGEAGGAEALIVVAEVKTDADGLDLAEVTAAVRSAVTVEFSVTPHDIVLVAPATLPKTSSGKLQRHACREAYAAGTLEAAVPALLSEGAR
ncbi:fatty acyl-AMP ligase [Nocardia cyriacigeorgica]|uniref:fatty acyl-AMP ligase n=1 Tax=Nocardia cyriacigeorgica TaxID=135487 RepID=UPI0024564C02|nr:fatty acyl-AMP ligase [Nocardia cyriacigeorgica]